MGEIEGHYQPVLKDDSKHMRIGALNNAVLHYAYDDKERWQARHKNYAFWEDAMIARGAYPKDPVKWREKLKRILRRMPFRGAVMFLYSYVWKRGFLDGGKGYDFAQSRADYYRRRF